MPSRSLILKNDADTQGRGMFANSQRRSGLAGQKGNSCIEGAFLHPRPSLERHPLLHQALPPANDKPRYVHVSL